MTKLVAFQGLRFNINKPGNGLHHRNRLNDINYIIVSINAKNDLGQNPTSLHAKSHEEDRNGESIPQLNKF